MNKKEILKELQPFLDNKILVKKRQSVNNIIEGVLNTHDKYINEYKKIYHFFDGQTVEDIAQNLFVFLKNNVPYKAESEHFQTLRSPSAILSLPADCKSYSLFIAGVLKAYNIFENENITYSFRFAGYDKKSNSYEHVFIVLYPNTSKELWIDVCLNYLDERKKPYIYTDKIYKPMALYTLSGVNNKNKIGLDVSEVKGWFGSIFDVFDNSTNKWKSRLAKLKDRTPLERLMYYYQLIGQNKNIDDAIQYAQMFGRVAEQIPDTTNLNFNDARDYNELILQTFPSSNFAGGVGTWKIPYTDLLINLDETIKPTNGGANEGSSGGGPKQKNNVVPLAATALILYKIFG